MYPQMPEWSQLVEGLPAWHASQCFSPAVSERIIFLANISSEPCSQSPQGATILHPIFEQGDPAVTHVRRQMAAAAQLPLTHCEPLFVLEYLPGWHCNTGQAMPHHDWNCPGGSSESSEQNLGCPQLRVVTSLAYLTSVPSGWGGQTRLPRAGIEVQARAGSCFLWYNADKVRNDSSQPAEAPSWIKRPSAQHHGVCLPARSEVALRMQPRKLVAVQWIRASPFNYSEELSADSCEEDPTSCQAAVALQYAVEQEQANVAAAPDRDSQVCPKSTSGTPRKHKQEL